MIVTTPRQVVRSDLLILVLRILSETGKPMLHKDWMPVKRTGRGGFARRTTPCAQQLCLGVAIQISLAGAHPKRGITRTLGTYIYCMKAVFARGGCGLVGHNVLLVQLARDP